MSRANYLATTSAIAIAHGFRPAPEHPNTQDFGLTVASGAAIGVFDPVHLTSIAPAIVPSGRAY